MSRASTGRKARRATAMVALAAAAAATAAAIAAASLLGGRPAETPSGPATAGTAAAAGTVVSVADGDTLTVAAGGKKTKIRLLGIDAPETAHDGQAADCGADAAKAGLAKIAPEGSQVSYTLDPASDPADKYGRTLAYLSTKDTSDAALELIRAGLVEAWIPAGEPRPSRWAQYAAAQSQAQQSNTGSWAHCPTLGR